MRAKVEAVFIGMDENSFKDSRTGETVEYRRATFNVRDTFETFVLGVPKDVDATGLKQYKDAFVLVDFRFNSNNNSFKGRLAEVFPDAKSMSAAPLLSEDVPF